MRLKQCLLEQLALAGSLKRGYPTTSAAQLHLPDLLCYLTCNLGAALILGAPLIMGAPPMLVNRLLQTRKLIS
jgi:hypothetical protein